MIKQLFRRTYKIVNELGSGFIPGYLNDQSTAKTTVGYMATFMERRLPSPLRRKSLQSIFNYLPVSENLITSGQPSEFQMVALKNSGVTHVINLAPHHAENALRNEKLTVTSLGMKYTHIPVDFNAPSEQDFAIFCDTVSNTENGKVLIHCAANMRVSAFVYRYRIQQLGVPVEVAKKDLHKIWVPFDQWDDFIQRQR